MPDKKRKIKKVSEYGKQLQEKQELKKIYGIREKQMRRYVEKAGKMPGSPSDNLLKLLELRLDNVIFRLGFAVSRPHARQMVSHGFFAIKDKKITIPSYSVSVGDLIQPKNTDKFKEFKFKPVGWIETNQKELSGTILRIPSREEIDTPINENLVVQFYSR
jgi:small subunit ribosomal protein S4